MHWALLAATLLILLSQLRVLLRLVQGRAPTPPRVRVTREILLDAALALRTHALTRPR